MSDEIMPAAEAATTETNERFTYELAFHVLPTVAEGEVVTVFDAVKSLITGAGAELTVEEAPAKFDLAYEIVKHLDGKNRKFSSAYFGWVRFTAEADMIAVITEGVEEHAELLRHLLVRLSKAEEAHPFYFHEALAAQNMVSTVEESAVVPDVTTVAEGEKPAEEKVVEAEKKTEEPVEVNESELDEALKKDEA